MVMHEGSNIIHVAHEIFVNIVKPALEMLKDYGDCSEMQKREFIYGINSFVKFLGSKLLLKVIGESFKLTIQFQAQKKIWWHAE